MAKLSYYDEILLVSIEITLKKIPKTEKNGAIINVEVQSNIIYFKNQKVKLVIANDITQMQHITY
jgi:hypothetical protein